MTRSTWLKSIVALLLSLSIAFYFNQYLLSLKEEVEVIVAAKDIPAETRITSEMLKTIKVNKADQSLLAPYAAKDVNSVVNLITLISFKVDDVIINQPDKLIKSIGGGDYSIAAGGKVSKAYLIPPDKRAISIKVDAEGALAFSLGKGDKVDVILTSTGAELNGVYSTILLQKIEILDIEMISEKDKEQNISTTMQNVSLLVTPQEAQDLALAKRKGKIDLMLNPVSSNNSTIIPLSPSLPSKFLNPKGGR